jgi:hypothetical protein
VDLYPSRSSVFSPPLLFALWCALHSRFPPITYSAYSPPKHPPSNPSLRDPDHPLRERRERCDH